MKRVFTADKDCRADVFIAQSAEISRSFAANLLESGAVTISGKICAKNHKLRPGDEITLDMPKPQSPAAEAENIPLDIVYEDDSLLVVNKPCGMVVHPAAGNKTGTLVNALLYHCGENLSGINGVIRPGILHRIDKNTSGLLLVAKNDRAHAALASQIKEHSLTREYEAVVHGVLKEDNGTINAPIGRHPVKRKQMAVNEKNGREAITDFTVLERFSAFTHIKLRLHTGRTHQIRVHMAYIGHPVAGDPVYGPKKPAGKGILAGQCLHARKIGFIHPESGEYMEFSSPLPDYFIKFLKECEN